jgi:hypothetical protein
VTGRRSSIYDLRDKITTVLPKQLGSGDVRLVFIDRSRDERILAVELNWDQVAQVQAALREGAHEG